MNPLQLQGVSETLLIPLFCKAWESEEQRPIVHDRVARLIAQELEQVFKHSSRRFHRDILARRWPSRLQVLLALRARYFDRVTERFLLQHPQGQVVQLGCGLDSRYDRLKRPSSPWLEVDFESVIQLRQALFPKAALATHFAGSVYAGDWMSQLDTQAPTLLLAEGLFIYARREQLQHFFKRIAESFTQAELLAEFASDGFAYHMSEGLLKDRYQKRFGLSKSAGFQGGLHHGREPESWHPQIRLLNEWTYFQERETRLGALNLLQLTPLKYLQWVLHYQIRHA